MSAPGGIDEESARKILVGLQLIDTADAVSLRRLTAGASRAMYVADSHRRGETETVRRFVFRLGGDSLGAAHGLGLEARLLGIARAGGVPAPEVFAVDEDFSALGSPYLLMEYIQGDTLPKRIISAPSLAQARAALPGQLGAALGKLHSVELKAVPDELAARRDEVDVWRRMLDSYQQPHPAFELALRWLESHRPAPMPDVLLHGDYRVGNIIVDDNGLAAVLDWELAHVGDPREDLGWLCAPSWRFGQPRPVGGVGEYEQLLDAYRRTTGLVVNARDLHWFEVLGTLRWGVLCVGQTMRHLRRTTRSVELAALGRRVCEIEWDLLESIR